MATPKTGTEGLNAVADLAKQIITLGSALIGLTVTFAEKFAKKPTPQSPIAAPSQLAWAWGAYILSILFAVMTLMAVAGSLNEIDHRKTESNPSRTNTKIWGGLMLLGFVAGLALTASAGWTALR